jgi:predicted aspartyl protease
MRRKAGVVAIVLGLFAAHAPAWAGPCQVVRIVELPVTMTGRRPVVTAQINGRDARFILDSGAFFSTIARANALDYGLPIRALPGATLRGIGGETSMQAATAKEFGIAGHTIKSVDFAVGGSDTGYAGLLGQNILGLADAEYDLPHGIVRLTKAEDCRNANLAVWAGAKPVTIVPIEPMGPGQRHTIGTVTVNGVKMKALFDTGAPTVMLTFAAAKRIGLTPDSPGVTPSGAAAGLGTHFVRAWRARLDSIDIGGETIPHPWVEIADESLQSSDMLIGVDFFLAHHLYVDNQNHRMFITYEGGPFFGLEPKRAVDDRGAAIDLTDTSGEPTDAAGYGRRGAILASQQKFELAIADFDKAIAMEPGQVHYLYQRAIARLANRQPLLGAADLDKAIGLAPSDADARLARARLRIGSRDPSGALEDLKAADDALAPSADARQRTEQLIDNCVNCRRSELAAEDLAAVEHRNAPLAVGIEAAFHADVGDGERVAIIGEGRGSDLGEEQQEEPDLGMRLADEGDAVVGIDVPHHRRAALGLEAGLALLVECGGGIAALAPLAADEIAAILGEAIGLNHGQAIVLVELIAPFVDDLLDGGDRHGLFQGEAGHISSPE